MAEKRAHHNALERKRRDHIKDSFCSLRESVPELRGEKVASRAIILKKAANYIEYMKRKNVAHMKDIDYLRTQNIKIELQINSLEKAIASGNFDLEAHSKSAQRSSYRHCTDSESDNSDSQRCPRARYSKKILKRDNNVHYL